VRRPPSPVRIAALHAWMCAARLEEGEARVTHDGKWADDVCSCFNNIFPSCEHACDAWGVSCARRSGREGSFMLPLPVLPLGTTTIPVDALSTLCLRTSSCVCRGLLLPGALGRSCSDPPQAQADQQEGVGRLLREGSSQRRPPKPCAAWLDQSDVAVRRSQTPAAPPTRADTPCRLQAGGDRGPPVPCAPRGSRSQQPDLCLLWQGCSRYPAKARAALRALLP
jgi:hypothetical protein